MKALPCLPQLVSHWATPKSTAFKTRATTGLPQGRQFLWSNFPSNLFWASGHFSQPVVKCLWLRFLPLGIEDFAGAQE